MLFSRKKAQKTEEFLIWVSKKRRNSQRINNISRSRNEKEIFELCDKIRETSFALHRYLRHGHLEKVYENGLAHRLRLIGMKVGQQKPLKVYDEDGTVLGDFIADLVIDGQLIVELKACKALAEEHVAQVLGYLRASQFEHGLLINFGAPKLQIKKFIMSNQLDIN